MKKLLLLASAFLLGPWLASLGAAEPTQRPGGGRGQGAGGRQRPGNRRPGGETQRPGGRTQRPGGAGGQRPGGRPQQPAGPQRPGAPQRARQGPGRPPQQRPRGGPGQQEPEGEEEEQGGTVLVLTDSDAVILRDGTRINGTILCAGAVAVTILTPEGEKTIPREKVERLVKKADAKSPQEFTPEELDGHKYLMMGSGTLLTVPTTKKDEGPEIVPQTPATAQPAKPVQPQPAAAARPAKPRPLAQPRTALPKAKAPAVRKPAAPKQAAEALPKLQVPQDPAKLTAFLRKLRQEGTLADYLRDPEFRKALREAVRKQQQQKNKPQ